MSNEGRKGEWMDEGVIFTTTDTGSSSKEEKKQKHAQMSGTQINLGQKHKVHWVTDEMDLKSHGFRRELNNAADCP